MAGMCITHRARSATGACVRCGGGTCALCVLDVDGTLYCSVLCFTEQALEAKGKPLVRNADPLAAVDLSEPSVVLGSPDAEPADDSSILMSSAAEDDRSETSILDLTSRRREIEDSSIVPMTGPKDPTSILDMRGWAERPPTSDTPVPMVLPGTRRSTIQSPCVFHADTPAVVRCSTCADPICTMCIGDEERGGTCFPLCRREIRARRRKQALILAAAASAVLVVWALIANLKKDPKPSPTPAAAVVPPPVVARVDPPKPEPAPAPAPIAVVEPPKPPPPPPTPVVFEPKPEPPKPPPPAPKPEPPPLPPPAPPKVEPKPEPPPVPKPEPPKPPPPAPKPEPPPPPPPPPPKVEPKPEPAPIPKPEPPKPPPPAPKPQPPPPPKPVEPTPLERAMGTARDLIRTATPEFCDLAAEAAQPLPEDPRPLLARLSAVESKLTQARDEYDRVYADAPDRPLLEGRIRILGQLLSSLKQLRARCTEDR